MRTVKPIYRVAQKMYTQFNRDYLRTLFKVEPNYAETLNDMVYLRQPATLAALREEIEMSCAAITVDTLVNVARSVVRRTQMCLDANGEHFEHFQ
jgi:hypothetical protein